MKSKLRFLPVIIIAFVCCLFTACFKTYYWKVAQGIENIAKIEIYDSYGREEQELMCEISPEYYEEIVNDIQSLPAKRQFAESFGFYGRQIVIKFADDTYDVIAIVESTHVTKPNGTISSGKTMRIYYQTNEFNLLIDKWIAKS